MIKQTFLNLPEDKRQRIISAVVVEFWNVPAEKVSINRIIKRAGISRGSFYQYFDDKVDLIEVLLKSVVDFLLAEADRMSRETGGDIFVTYEKMFDIIADYAETPENGRVLKSLARNIHANDDLVSEYLINRFKGLEEFGGAADRFSREGLRFTSDEDMENLSQMLNIVIKNAIFNLLVTGQSRELVRSSFVRKLEIIECGARLPQ